MNILIPDEWLRNFLETPAESKKIGECLSLCGPSVEKIIKKDGSDVYDIEITTNRVDSAGVYGIAREAFAILPRFKIKVEFAEADPKIEQKFSKKVKYLKADVDSNLCPRFTAVLIKNVEIDESPDWMKERLSWVGVNPKNNVVDITNYIMHEIGQPVHTFDYDKIKGAEMHLRKSKKGEEITTLDGTTHKLPGDDIVIEDGEGRLIDLAGIMGGKNSEVDKNTKNVLLFVQTYNPVNIRKTSMSLPKRTEAAVLFEKGLDTENVELGIGRGIELLERLANGRAEDTILDLYPNPYKMKKVNTNLDFIEKRLGIEIKKTDIDSYLKPLGFETKWKDRKLEVKVPSFRKDDIDKEEDILEEVARIYGYHNIPSKLMTGKLPEKLTEAPFEFEALVKNTLKSLGSTEVYTLSLVPDGSVEKNALKLKNPLGDETAFLRTSLMPSLIKAVKDNKGYSEPFHLFEMSNVYIPRKGRLPEEKMALAGIFSNYNFRNAKGAVETLLSELNIKATFKTEDAKDFKPSRRVVISSGGASMGELGVTEEEGLIYYEFDTNTLRKLYKPYSKYQPVPKYPPQIEDLTIVLPEKTKVGKVVQAMKEESKRLVKVTLNDIYKDAYTFRVWYQHPEKTLKDEEVKKIRKKILKKLKSKFGAMLKD